MTGDRGTVRDAPALRGGQQVFRDRRDAGRTLAELIARPIDAAVVLAIVPGGAPVGVEIARRHAIPLCPAVVAVLRPPWRSRSGCGAVAYGAVAFDGTLLFDRRAAASLAIERRHTEIAVEHALEVVSARARAYGAAVSYPLADLDIAGGSAIVVDDGLSPDIAVRTVMAAARNRGARRVVLARPAARGHELRRLAREADRTYCASVHGGFRYSPADAYARLDPIADEDARALVRGIAPPSGMPRRARVLQATRP